MTTKTPVLITAATRWEATPLAKGLGLTASQADRLEGSIVGRRVVLARTGMGAAKTTEALNRDFVIGDFGLVISAGLCGAMQQDVKSGDIVADVAGVEMGFVVPLREAAQRLATPFHFGKILHTNIILQPDAKRKLGQEYRALACDMETAAVRRWADQKTPAIGIRVVLDELDDTVPGDAPENDDAPTLARYTLSHAATLPALIKTGWRSARAMKSLSRFLAAYLEAI